MMRKYYTEEEKAEVKGGGKKKKEEPKSKGTDGVEPSGSTIGDCERTCQRSRTPRMGNIWLSSAGSG